MIETLLGGLLGGAFRLAPEILKWLDRKGERGHELAMQDKALEFEKRRGAQRMAEIGAGADATWNTGGHRGLAGVGRRPGPAVPRALGRCAVGQRPPHDHLLVQGAVLRRQDRYLSGCDQWRRRLRCRGPSHLDRGRRLPGCRPQDGAERDAAPPPGACTEPGGAARCNRGLHLQPWSGRLQTSTLRRRESASGTCQQAIR